MERRAHELSARRFHPEMVVELSRDRLAVVSSNLSRLFTYAKATKNDARENFTTEALAAAIRHDPSPMLELLADAAVISKRAKLIEVLTQMNVPGVGIIDLVLVLDGSEVWVEVKVDAGESKNQLNNYLTHLANTPTIKLVTLAKTSLRADITALKWQALRRAINHGVTSPYWIDFRTYLEEIHMADAFDEPISTAERSALEAGHSLLRKVARMLVPVAESAARMAPYLDWRCTENEVLRNVTKQLRERGTMNINSHADLRAGISVGAYPEKGETGLGVWVWNQPSATAVRRELLDAADAGKLPVAWERSQIGWEALGNYAQLSEFSDHKAAAAWLIERLRELESAGLMKLIPALGMPVFGDSLAGEEGEARDD